jgi:maleate isomerase
MNHPIRVGMIVPSSNTTMETEIPALLRRREAAAPERFTVHASRMAMKTVSREELARMDRESDRCAAELADARCDALAYACLVAIMAAGPGYHCVAEARLARISSENGSPTPVITSAGALIAAISALDARKIALIAPYMKPLTGLVVGYLEASGIEVVDAISLEVADNLSVGRMDPMQLVDLSKQLNVARADAVIISACVQMPSLPAIQVVEERVGLPVISAATATTQQLLARLGLEPLIPGAGRLLAGGRMHISN